MRLLLAFVASLALASAALAQTNIPPTNMPPFTPNGYVQGVVIYGPDGKVAAASSGGGSASAPGAREQDVRATSTLPAATLNGAVTLALNGQGTVGFTFTGLTGTGAVLTYEQSNDGGTTWTGINEVNSGTGIPAATRAADGQVRLGVSGRTNIRVRVSTAGTGTITVTSNITVREGIVAIGTPLPPGTNAIGSITNAFALESTQTGVATSNAAIAAATGTQTDAATASGASSTMIGALRSIRDRLYTTMTMTIFGTDGATNRQVRTTTTGVLEPPTAAAGKVTETAVALTANTSTTLVAANANRIAMEIQCDGTAAVGIGRTGATLTSAAGAGLVIPSGSYPLYTAPVASLTAVTAFTPTAQTCRVTEYIR